MAKVTAQSKFNKAMASGKQMTVEQIRKLGLSNVHDAAYKARNFHGLNVQRYVISKRTGDVSVYALEA